MSLLKTGLCLFVLVGFVYVCVCVCVCFVFCLLSKCLIEDPPTLCAVKSAFLPSEDLSCSVSKSCNPTISHSISPSFDILWSPTRIEVIHHPGQLHICEKCCKAWTNYLSAAGHLKYGGLIPWSSRTWVAGRMAQEEKRGTCWLRCSGWGLQPSPTFTLRFQPADSWLEAEAQGCGTCPTCTMQASRSLVKWHLPAISVDILLAYS